jgi:hypothetical protein
MLEKSVKYTSGYGANVTCIFLILGGIDRAIPGNHDGPHALRLKRLWMAFNLYTQLERYIPASEEQ